MKLLLLILLFPQLLLAQTKPQQSTKWQGDSSFRVQMVSYDTSKVKVYNGDSMWYLGEDWTHPSKAPKHKGYKKNIHRWSKAVQKKMAKDAPPYINFSDVDKRIFPIDTTPTQVMLRLLDAPDSCYGFPGTGATWGTITYGDPGKAHVIIADTTCRTGIYKDDSSIDYSKMRIVDPGSGYHYIDTTHKGELISLGNLSDPYDYGNLKLTPYDSTHKYGFNILVDTHLFKLGEGPSKRYGFDISRTGKMTYYLDGKEYTKADTIGSWRLVSDTARDHWNGVSCMWVYEVRVYKETDWIEAYSPATNTGNIIGVPRHFCWLDSKKKLLTMAVWLCKPE